MTPDDDRPPLPPTCRTDEPWVNPWATEPARRRPSRMLVIQLVTMVVLLFSLALGVVNLSRALWLEPAPPRSVVVTEQHHCV